MRKSNEIKAPSFHIVYDVFLANYGHDVSLIISYMSKRQTFMTKYRKVDIEGYFYQEHNVISKNTGISEHRQKIAMKILQDLGILKISPRKKGVPPKTFYKVDIQKYGLMVKELNEKKRSESNVKNDDD